MDLPDQLQDMKEFIVNPYDGKSLIRERGDWKQRMKAVATNMRFKVIRFNEDAWQAIHEALIILQIFHKI